MTKIFIHKTAIVDTNNIGEGSRIWAFVHILAGAKIGKNANICDNVFIENKVTIGNNVTIKSGVYLWDDLTVEDNVMIGPAAAFTNDRLPRSRNKNWIRDKVLLKEGSTIGGNATILPKITVGKHALVGAGSVVTKDVPDFALVYGNPAKVQGYICICTRKLDFKKNVSDCKCGRKYKREEDEVKLL